MRKYVSVFFAVLMLGACSDARIHAPEPPRPLPHVDYYPHPPAYTHCLDARDPSGCMGRVEPQQ